MAAPPSLSCRGGRRLDGREGRHLHPTRDFRWPQPPDEVFARWAIRRCRFESYVLPTREPVSWDHGNSAVFGLRCLEFEITDSVVIGYHGAVYINDGMYGRIERNTFRTVGPSGGGPVKGGRYCLIQDNLVDISTRVIFPGWRECYVAWNIQWHIGRDQNAGESLLAENHFGPYWQGQPAAIGEASLTIPDAAWAAVAWC